MRCSLCPRCSCSCGCSSSLCCPCRTAVCSRMGYCAGHARGFLLLRNKPAVRGPLHVLVTTSSLSALTMSRERLACRLRRLLRRMCKSVDLGTRTSDRQAAAAHDLLTAVRSVDNFAALVPCTGLLTDDPSASSLIDSDSATV